MKHQLTSALAEASPVLCAKISCRAPEAVLAARSMFPDSSIARKNSAGQPCIHVVASSMVLYDKIVGGMVP